MPIDDSTDHIRKLHRMIEATSLLLMKRELYLAAIRYAGIRARWHLALREERLAMNQERTVAHNALIDACNILSRNMAANDEDNSWRAEIGESRQEIGDFACRLTLLFSLLAR